MVSLHVLLYKARMQCIHQISIFGFSHFYFFGLRSTTELKLPLDWPVQNASKERATRISKSWLFISGELFGRLHQSLFSMSHYLTKVMKGHTYRVMLQPTVATYNSETGRRRAGSEIIEVRMIHAQILEMLICNML